MTEEVRRDAAAVHFFPPGIPLAAIVAGVVLDRYWPIDPGLGPEASVRHWVGGVTIVGAILGLGLWSVLLFRRSGQNENPWKPTPAIVERGPFRISRNPMYLQMVLVCIGAAGFSWNAWILILTPVAAWLLQKLAIEPEEVYLERKFGEAYRSYKRRVRRWI
jgi:protein-S-isoprenylcysteine O-methyltransferase Ste14